MNNRGFRGRGIGPRGVPGSNASAATFSGPRFPHPNFRPLRPLLNRPTGPRTWTVRSPRARPFLHWQSNGIARFQNFPRHNVQFRPNAFATQFRPHNRGRPSIVRPGGHFSGNVISVPHDYEADSSLRSNESDVIKDDVSDSISLQVPLPGSEEERQQKIAETANRLKEKLSSISKENMISFWEDDFTILKPVTSELETVPDKSTADLKYGSPELGLTFNDFRDIGRVRSESTSKTDTIDGTNCTIVLQNEVEIIDVMVQETEVNIDNDTAIEASSLENYVGVRNKNTQSLDQSKMECSDGKISSESHVSSNLKDMQLNLNNVSVALTPQSQECTESNDGHCTVIDNATDQNDPTHTAILQPGSFCTKRADSKTDQIQHQLHNLHENVQQNNSQNVPNVPESKKLKEAQNSQQVISSGTTLNSKLSGNHKKVLNRSTLPQGQSHSTKTGSHEESTISQQASSVSSMQKHMSGRKLPNQSQNMKEQSQIPTLPFKFDVSVPPPNNNLLQSKDSGNKSLQSAVCTTSKSNMPSNYIHNNKGDLLQSPLGFDPRTPPPTFTQNNKAFSKVNTFYSQTQPSSTCDQREYLQPPLVFDPRLSSEERSNLLAHVSNDTLRPNCTGNNDSVPGFNTSAVATNFFQMPPVVQPLNFTPDIRMNYLPVLAHVSHSPQVPLQKLSTSTTQVSYECRNQVLKPVVLEHSSISQDLQKKTSEHVNNELEDMQEAMEFAKQVMSMSDKVNDITDIRMPECPQVLPTASLTINEKVSRDVRSHLDPNTNSKISIRNKEKKVKPDKPKTDTIQQLKPVLKIHEKEEKSKPVSHMKTCNTNSHNVEIKKDLLLKDDQFRSKVTFNLHTKVKKIQSDRWQEKMKDNDKRAKEMIKAKKSKDKDLVPQHGTTHDTCKNKKISKECKSDVPKSNEFSGTSHGSKESSSTVVAGHISLAPVEVCNIAHEKVNTETDEIHTTPLVTQKSQSTIKSSKKAVVSVTESSWKNRVINRFLRMSKNDICNMVNNSSLRKFDIAMKHLVKERRSSLSLELRNTEEEKIKSYDREEFMNQLNAMLDPSAVVDISNLPTEFIHHLSEVLQLDPMPFDTEQSLSDSQTTSPVPHETKQNVSDLNTRYEDCESSQSQTVFNIICEDLAKDEKKNEETHSATTIKLDVDPVTDKTKTFLTDETKTINTPKKSTAMFNMVDLDDIFSEVIAKVQNDATPEQRNRFTKKSVEPEKVYLADRKQCPSVTQDSLNTSEELVSNSRRTVVDFDDIFAVNVAKTEFNKQDDDDRMQDNTADIEDKCSSQMESREWTRCDQDDSLAFRNLTKEEWEAKYGSLQSAEDESRSSGFHNKVMYDTSSDQYMRNRRSRRISSMDSSKRRLSVSPDNFHASQNLSEQEFFNSDEHTSSYKNQRILRTPESSSTEVSNSDSSNQSSEDMSKVDVVKLLKVIKEKEKIAKTRSLSETLRDEISAEIERSRNEKGKHRERKFRKRERREKEKKGKRRKQKKKRRKRISDSNSSNSDTADTVSKPRLLTENEIKKEVPVKDENNTETTKDVDLFSYAPEGACSKEILLPPSRCEVSNKKKREMPMTIVPAMHLKTKAQLKQMPEPSENYVRTEASNCATVSSTPKPNNESTSDIKEDKPSKAAKHSISTQEYKVDKRALTPVNISESVLNITKQREGESDPKTDKEQDITVQDSGKCEMPGVKDDKHKKQQNNDANVKQEQIKDVCSFSTTQLGGTSTANVSAEQDTPTLLEKNSAEEKVVLKNPDVHDSLEQDKEGMEEKSSATTEKPLKKLDIETYKKRMQRRKFMEQIEANRSATKVSLSSESLLPPTSDAMGKRVCEAVLNATTNLQVTDIVKSRPDPEIDCLPSHQKDIISTVPKQIVKTEDKGAELSKQRHVHNNKPNEKAVNTRGIADAKDTNDTKPFHSEGQFVNIAEERINFEIAKMNMANINPTTESSQPTEIVKAKTSTLSADSSKVQPCSAGKLLSDITAHSSKFSKIRSEEDRKLKLKKKNVAKIEKKDSLEKGHGSQYHEKRNLSAASTKTKQVCCENVNEMEKLRKTEDDDTNLRSKCADVDGSEKCADLQYATNKIITNVNTVKEDVQLELTNSQRNESTKETLETVHRIIKNEEVEDSCHDSLNTSIDGLNAISLFKSIHDPQNETVSAITCEDDNASNAFVEKTIHNEQTVTDNSTSVQAEKISCSAEENDTTVIDDINEKSPPNLIMIPEVNENTTNKEEILSLSLTDSSPNAKALDTENGSFIGQALATNKLKEEELQREEASILPYSADAVDTVLKYQDKVCSPISTDILSPESSNSPFKGFTEEITTCMCTKQSRIIDISLQISDTEKHEGLENKDELRDPSLDHVCCEIPTNNSTYVPSYDLAEGVNAQLKQSASDFGKHQNTENITSDTRNKITLKEALIASPTQEEKESVLINEVMNSAKCAENFIANETRDNEAKKEKEKCDTIHVESSDLDIKNKATLNQSSSKIISTTDSNATIILVPLLGESIGISQEIVSCDQIENQQTEVAVNEKENNPSNKSCGDIKQLNIMLMNTQATKEKDGTCTNIENSAQPNTQSKDQPCVKMRKDLEARSTVNCNKFGEQTPLAIDIGIPNSKEYLPENRSDEDKRPAAAPSIHMSKSSDAVHHNYTKRGAEITSDNDTLKQKLSDSETMQNSPVYPDKIKHSGNLQTEAKEGPSNGNDSNENSSNKHFKENGKRRRSSKLHAVKDKQQMKSKSENKYNVSKENIQVAVQSDVVKLVSKETIISRMIEIDVEIHKLMIEKMTLYKLLENERSNEGISPDSSTPSDDKRKEILKVRPDAPTVISQLIKNTDMSSNKNAQAAVKSSTENALPKKRKHKNERTNVEKSKSDNLRRKRSEAYLNMSSDDDEILRYAERKSLSPSKKKRRKIEEATGRDETLEMEFVNVTQTAEVDKKQSEMKPTSKKSHMTESAQTTKQSFRHLKYQKTKETDIPRSANEALNENVIDSTNQFIGYKSQTYDSDNSKTKPSQSSLSLTASIYSDESTVDSLDQGSSSAKSDSRKSTGLALLEESFKREMAASKKLKTVARRKKKKQIKNLLSTVNNLTVEEEELPLNKLYIRKLQQKRDLLVSLDNPIEATGTMKTSSEKSESMSKHLDKIINDVAENRIEDFPENLSKSQLIDNTIEKVSSTQMEDDECLTATQTFADNSVLDETVETNSSYPKSETKQSNQGFTTTLLADSHVLKSLEDVTNKSVDFHQNMTVGEEREPVGSTQTDNVNETTSMSPRTAEDVLQIRNPAKESEKEVRDDTRITKIHVERDSKIRRSTSNQKLDAEEKTSDQIDECKRKTDDAQFMDLKVEQNTAALADIIKSKTDFSEKGQTDIMLQKSAAPISPGEDASSNNDHSQISAAEDTGKLGEWDSPANETMCTFTGSKDQTNVLNLITLDVKNDNDKPLPKHEDNSDVDVCSTHSKEATTNLLLEQTARDTKDVDRASREILEPMTASSIPNAQNKPALETDKKLKTCYDENTSGKGVTRRRKKGRKLPPTAKRVDQEEKEDSDVNKSLLNVEGSRQTESSIQEKNTKSNVSSKSLRPSQSSQELADNVSSNAKRRLILRKPQSIGIRKHAACDFPAVFTMDTMDHRESQLRAVKRKQHSMWEMMNCKVRLVDSKYTILRPDVNLNILRQLGISTINPYVRRKSTQVDSTVNFYQGKESQEARMPIETVMVPQSTKHKDTTESLHDTPRVVLKSDNTPRERVVEGNGQGRLTRSEISQRKCSIDAVESCNSKSSTTFVEESVATNSHDKLSVDLLMNNEENPDIEILEEKIHVKEQPRHTEDIPASCELDIVEEVEQPRTQYTAHKGPILDIKIFNDSFLAASEDGMIYRYNQASNELLNVYKGHTAAVTCLYINKMSNVESTREYMYSGALDGTLRCYDIVSGAEVKGAIQIGSPIQCMDQAWGIIFIGTKSGHVSRFHVKSNDVRGDTIQFSDKSVLALKATNEGPRKVLIVASRNQPITIRDAQTGLFLRIISGQKSHTVYSLMRDNNLIYCGTSSTSIPVFDFTNGEQTMQYNAGVGIVCMRLYQQLLFAGCYDGNIYVFDTKDRRLVCSIPGPGNMLLSMEIVRYKIIAGSKDKHLQTWLMPRQVRDLLNK